MLSVEEKQKSISAIFQEANHSGDTIAVTLYVDPAGLVPRGLVFDLKAQVVRLSLPGQAAQEMPLGDISRFEVEIVSQEGDDKTHYHNYLLLGSPERTWVFYERGIERVWTPMPETSSREKISFNLSAIQHYLAPFNANIPQCSRPPRALQSWDSSEPGRTQSCLCRWRWQEIVTGAFLALGALVWYLRKR